MKTGLFQCGEKSSTTTRLEATPDGYKLDSRNSKRILSRIDNGRDRITATVDNIEYQVALYYDGAFLLYPKGYGGGC